MNFNSSFFLILVLLGFLEVIRRRSKLTDDLISSPSIFILTENFETFVWFIKDTSST